MSPFLFGTCETTHYTSVVTLGAGLGGKGFTLMEILKWGTYCYVCKETLSEKKKKFHCFSLPLMVIDTEIKWSPGKGLEVALKADCTQHPAPPPLHRALMPQIRVNVLIQAVIYSPRRCKTSSNMLQENQTLPMKRVQYVNPGAKFRLGLGVK